MANPAMRPDDEFRSLLDRVARHDEDATNELIRRYEPEIRVMVRAWLRPWEVRLRRVFDSQDICQSVLAWFFLKNASGRYDLSCPDNLRRLLRVMVRNRVYYRIRGAKPGTSMLPIPTDLDSRSTPPDEAVAAKDLFEAVFSRFSAEEADLARRRMSGESWDEISSHVGGTADARRMQLARAANRLARELQPVE
jgi:RNA polymerase sigma-70 factor (ECF subfamily)